MLSTSGYLAGVALLLIALGGALLGAVAVRRRLLAGWTGAPAWLAVAMVAVALLIWVAELLGSAGLFERIPFALAMLAVGAGLRLWLGSAAAAAEEPAPPAPPADRRMTVVAALLAAVTVAHFTIGVRLRLSTGMTGFDSTWYHGPFAAAFAQSGSTFDIHFIAPQFLAWFYPQNSELVHGIGILAFHRDLLSPLLNLGWLGGVMVAAWCIGRPFGAGPVSLAGAAVVLDTGALADQAGEARNDIVAIFFLLAAAAILVNALAARGRGDDLQAAEGQTGRPAGAGWLGLGPLLLCGLGAGLAAGTKLNLLLPALVLVGGIGVIAPAGKRRWALLATGLAALAGGGYWYLRNLAHAGNPLPWVRHLGPITLPGPGQAVGGREDHSVLSYLTDSGVISDWFLPGLHSELGILWPALIALALAGPVLCLSRRAAPGIRLLGLVALAVIAAWVIAPTSASGPEGTPVGFESGLRYLAPALALGLALAPLAPALRDARRRWALLAGLVLVFAFADASGEPWFGGYLATAIVAGVFAFAVIAAVTSGRLRPGRGVAAATAVAVLVLAIAGGEKLQRDYLRSRYANPGFTVPGLDAAFKWARGISGARIATTGTREYPLFGTDLSNRVQFVGIHEPDAGFVEPETCRAWRRALNEGGYDYVVATRDRFEDGKPVYPPSVGWTEGDPAATVVFRKPPTVVFRLSGALDPNRC